MTATRWEDVVHAFDPRTHEAEAGGSLGLRPVWFTEQSSRTARAPKRNYLEKSKTERE